jgi:hypothetical protein
MPVFSLSEVRTNQIKNYENTFEEQVVSNYGYIVAGSTGSNSSKISRIDLVTETNTDTNQNITFSGSFGCNTPGTSDYGFMFCGANPSGPGSVTTIHRISYTNETVTVSPAQTSFPLYIFSVGQNSQYAWNIAGYRDPPGGTCLVDRLDFSTESMAASTPFPSGRLYHYGFNSPSHHYFTGGEYSLPTRSATSDVNRLQFSNETFDTLSANNGASAQSGGAFADSSAGFGYYYGGYTAPGTIVDNLTKFDFSTDNAITESSLPVAVYGTASAESEFFGYSIGGLSNPYPTTTSVVQRYNFSQDTWSSAQNLPTIRFASFGQSLIGGTKITRGTPNFENWNESATYGYTICRLDSSYESNIDRIDMTTEVTSLPGSNDASNPRAGALTFSSNQYGYGLMGNDSSNYRTDITRIDFISETSSRVKDSSKSISNYTGRGTQNKNYGYGSGGYNGSNRVSTTVRFDFNTESFSELGKNLGVSKTGVGQLHSESYGYFAGGQIPSTGTDQDGIDKFDFSTESMFIIGSRLNTARDNCIGNQSNSFGYFAGGVTSGRISNVDRIDLSTDTTSAANNLTGARDGMGSTNTLSYGYWLGGNNPSLSPNRLSIVNRIDFETETISNPGNPMGSKGTGASSIQANTTIKQVGKNNRNDSRAGLDNQGRQTTASYGYIHYAEGSHNLDRMDYLNETISSLSDPPSYFDKAIVRNINYGYSISGRDAPTVPVSIVQRLDFTNETTTTLNPTNRNKQRAGYSQNSNYGYTTGGYNGSNQVCVIDRMDFETEVHSEVSTIPSGRNALTSVESNNYMYSVGGYSGPDGATVSIVDRMEFENETITSNLRFVRSIGFNNSYNSSEYGYVFSGQQEPGSILFCNIDRLNFATDTFSASTSLPTILTVSAGHENDNYGYMSGGATPSNTSNNYRMDFSNESISVPSGNLTGAARFVHATSNAQ